MMSMQSNVSAMQCDDINMSLHYLYNLPQYFLMVLTMHYHFGTLCLFYPRTEPKRATKKTTVEIIPAWEGKTSETAYAESPKMHLW